MVAMLGCLLAGLVSAQEPKLMAVMPTAAAAAGEVGAGASQYAIGLVDTKKGFRSTGELKLPAPFTRLVPGTIGQSNALFAENRTWYLLGTAGGTAAGEPEQMAALAVRYFAPPPGPAPTPVPAQVAARFNRTSGLAGGSAAVNIVWDDVCNIVVTTPTRGPRGTITFDTLMVSEYDGAVRPQAPLLSEPEAGVAAWRRAPGLGAMDAVGPSSGGPFAWNCGGACALLTLEQYGYGDGGHGDDDDEFDTMPQRLVGRLFHTGEVASNVSAAYGLRTLSAVGNPLYSAALSAAIHPERPAPEPQHAPFVGLGVCPPAAVDGADECGEPGALALLGYTTGLSQRGPEVLAKLGGGRAQPRAAVDEAIGLGVVVQERWDATSRDTYSAHVWLAGDIVSFDLTVDRTASAGVKAALNATVHVPGPAPIFWQQYNN